MTRKYQAALSASHKLLTDGRPGSLANDLYERLEGEGYWWDKDSGRWQKAKDKTQGKFSGSIFEDFNGLPSGAFRLRIMCHPEEVVDICAEVCQGLNVLEVSKPYTNHRGPGVRVYVTCKRSSKVIDHADDP